MLATLVSIKENLKCGSRLTDVAVVPLPRVVPIVKDKGDNFASYSSRMPGSRLPPALPQSIYCNMASKKSFEQTRLLELRNGNPSRSIIERIIQASMPKASRKHRKIGRVFRVRNPSEILDGFEKHREMVKKMAYLQYKSYPRNLVDGNELLRFYGTTISCCRKNKRPTESVTDLCNELHCGVCRVIGRKFDTEQTRKNGIRLNGSSEALSERVTWNSNRKCEKRAVIVCRTIAGTRYGGNELIRRTPGSSSEDIIVQNPNAVLPCFVIVFDKF